MGFEYCVMIFISFESDLSSLVAMLNITPGWNWHLFPLKTG